MSVASLRTDPGESSSRWESLGVLAAVTLQAAVIAWLISGETLESYLLKIPDSFDWLTNALRYAGVPVDSTWRTPVLPLIDALLMRLRGEGAIPFLGLVVVLCDVVGLLTVGRRQLRVAAPAAAALVGTNHFVLAHAVAIGADVLALSLAMTGILALATALESGRPAGWYVAAIAFSLGTMTQASVPMWLPAGLAMIALDGVAASRRRARSFHPWAAFALGVALALAISTIANVLGHPGPGEGTVVQRNFVLLKPSLRHLGYYLWSTLGAWSPLVVAFAVAGAVVGLRRPGWRRLTLGLLAALAGAFAFFAISYDFRTSRFVLYWTAPGLMLAAIGVGALPRRVRALAIVLTAVAGNLACTALAREDDVAIAWWPGDATQVRYADGLLAPPPESAAPFVVALSRSLARARAEVADVERDPLVHSPERQRLAATAQARLGPTATLYLELPPGLPEAVPYILGNQLALYARRRVEILAAEPPPGAIVAMPRGELARISWRRDVQLLDHGPRWFLVERAGAAPR